MRAPCGMKPRLIYGSPAQCGRPATLGWEQESGGTIPMCEECIAWTKTNRKYLKKLDDSTTDTTTARETT